MIPSPSYQQSVKEVSRLQLWTNAVNRLTTDRAQTRIIPESYMRNLWEYSKTKALKPYTNIQDLDVVPQEIVVIESCSADGWHLVYTCMWPVPVVLVVEG